GVLGPDLDEQRDVVDDHGPSIGRSRLRVALRGQPPDLGVDDRIEPLTGAVVGEDELRETGAVELAVTCQDPRTELRDDGVEAYRAGRDGLACEDVVIDDDGPQLAEASKDDRLARGDPARESDAQHASHPARGAPGPPVARPSLSRGRSGRSARGGRS